MASIYSNENVAMGVVSRLREHGHDVLTSHEAGNANRSIPDEDVLAFAHQDQRIVLTGNRDDFHRLHRAGAEHSGVVTFTDDADLAGMAAQIDPALSDPMAHGRFCARVTRGGHTFG